MKGQLENFWQEKRKVKIDGVWYDLAEIIEDKFVPKGKTEVEFTFNDEGNKKIINFIKRAFAKKSFGNSSSYSNHSNEVQEKIGNQWAINAAIEWLKAHNTTCEKDKRIEITETNIRDFSLRLSDLRDTFKVKPELVRGQEETPPEDY